MSQECDHNCESCSLNCSERSNPEDFIEKTNEYSHIKKVIAVVSGKGGVGKSMVSSLLACGYQKKGGAAAILDADITGPSIPKMFGIKDKAYAVEAGILPADTKTGIKLMSMNLLLDNDTDPVVWRSPIITSVVKQFWTDICWGDVDCMFVDMPPGTGDVPLTVFQSLPVDGIVVVTSPQDLVSMIVSKAVKMAELMNVPVVGIVENMSYFECPDCGKKHHIFGESHIEELAAKYGIARVALLPIDPAFAEAADEGCIEDISGDWLNGLLEDIEKITK